ncbi:hypothetical protein D3C75_896190 [compost metagenome]
MFHIRRVIGRVTDRYVYLVISVLVLGSDGALVGSPERSGNLLGGEAVISGRFPVQAQLILRQTRSQRILDIPDAGNTRYG